MPSHVPPGSCTFMREPSGMRGSMLKAAAPCAPPTHKGALFQGSARCKDQITVTWAC